MKGPYTLAFTLRDGRLERDGAAGSTLSVVDPIARELRFGDGRALPFQDVAAVAVVYTKQLVRKHIDHAITPTMVEAMRFSIVLVPSTMRSDVRALLEALARGEAPPAGSVRVAAEMVAEASIPAMSPNGAASARREGKAIAQVAGLPVFELYGEAPVFRPANALDLSLVEALRVRAPIEPGAPPPGVDARESEGRLQITVGAAPSRRLPFALIGVASIVLGGLLIAFADWRPGLFLLAEGLIVVGIAASMRPPRGTTLLVDDVAIEWTGESTNDRLEVAALEMIRVADDGTLVLVGQRDEVRCPLDASVAGWIRARIEQRLGPSPARYR